mmetsp:Transcript_13305/g.30279  ORF Transcript_13305/g.30279 Transcript_13305/m.30279 type:complete len:95 (+) Transcript_13305:63-347(+)
MVLSKRYAKAKSSKYANNIHRKGVNSTQIKKYPFTVGPLVLAFFIFVVLGSCKCSLFSPPHRRSILKAVEESKGRAPRAFNPPEAESAGKANDD